MTVLAAKEDYMESNDLDLAIANMDLLYMNTQGRCSSKSTGLIDFNVVRCDVGSRMQLGKLVGIAQHMWQTTF